MGFALGIVDPVISDAGGAPTMVIPTPPNPTLIIGLRRVYLGSLENEVSIAGDFHETHTVGNTVHAPVCVTSAVGTNRVFIGPARTPLMTTNDTITGGTTCQYPPLESLRAIATRVFVGPTI